MSADATPSPLEALLREVDALDESASQSPWLVLLTPNDGITHIRPVQHIETGIAVHKDYWPKHSTSEAATDDYGYLQPDALCEAPDGSIANARLTAHYRTAAPRLAAIVRVLREAAEMGARDIGKVYHYPGIALGIGSLLLHALRRADEIAGGQA